MWLNIALLSDYFPCHCLLICQPDLTLISSTTLYQPPERLGKQQPSKHFHDSFEASCSTVGRMLGGRCAVGFEWIICHISLPFLFTFTLFFTLLRSLVLFFHLDNVWVAVCHASATSLKASQVYLSNTDRAFYWSSSSNSDTGTKQFLIGPWGQP